MKKILLQVLIIFLFSAPLWAAGPLLEVEKPDAQYKDVIEGKDLIHTFNIKNPGDRNLLIKSVKARG